MRFIPSVLLSLFLAFSCVEQQEVVVDDAQTNPTTSTGTTSGGTTATTGTGSTTSTSTTATTTGGEVAVHVLEILKTAIALVHSLFIGERLFFLEKLIGNHIFLMWMITMQVFTTDYLHTLKLKL
jgi:hypothetical protein